MLEFVINKRSIHLQTPGPERKQLCGAWRMYNGAMPKATEEQINNYKLCGTCLKAARKRDDAPPLPFRVSLTEEDRDIVIEALGYYADGREPRQPILNTLHKFMK